MLVRDEDALKLVEEEIERRALTSRYPKKKKQSESHQPQGMYANVGYTYEGGAGEQEEDSEGESDHDDIGGIEELDSDNEAMASIDAATFDTVAEKFGIDEYTGLARGRRHRIAEENEEKESDIRRAAVGETLACKHVLVVEANFGSLITSCVPFYTGALESQA